MMQYRVCVCEFVLPGIGGEVKLHSHPVIYRVQGIAVIHLVDIVLTLNIS